MMGIGRHSKKKPPANIRDHNAESKIFMRRTLVVSIFIVILFGVLVNNLYDLQVRKFESYQTRSNNNRIKFISIPPSRGLIYDRNGKALALNRVIYQLEVNLGKVKDLPQQLEKLKSIIELTDKDFVDFEKEREGHRFATVPLKKELTEKQIAQFMVVQHNFPNFEIKGYQRRYYPYGEALTHVLGYVAKINESDIQWLTEQNLLKDYASTRDMGKLGLEKYYETLLHGQAGYAEVEINSRGRIIRQIQEIPPQAGADLYLTLDIDLQLYITKLMAGKRGAVVVSNPQDGSILAMVSSPSYDPNLFVNGISSKDFSKLLNNPDSPLYNRVTQGTYPPASTIKPYIAISALSENVIDTDTTIIDHGWWRLPNSKNKGPCTVHDRNTGCFRDWSWRRGGQGVVNLVRAIEVSSDTFFYQVAYHMGIDRLSKWMKDFGFGTLSGIDINEEKQGLMPSREWKMAARKEPWYQGDTIPVGIGQGYWKATPIQMIKALVTLINNGEIKTPHLLMYSQTENIRTPYVDSESRRILVPNETYWSTVKKGMHEVLFGAGGSAHNVFANAAYQAAGKSGTAQVFGLNKQVYKACNIPEHLRDHALFVAYAPFDKPEIAITLVVENSLRGGGSTAAPIVRQIMDHILLNQEYEIQEIKNQCP